MSLLQPRLLTEFTATFAHCLAQNGVTETRLPAQLDVASHTWIADWLMTFLLDVVKDAKMAAKTFQDYG